MFKRWQILVFSGLAISLLGCSSRTPEKQPHEFRSAVAPSAPGWTIPNVHSLITNSNGQTLVFRGGMPSVSRGEINELKAQGITNILIIKDEKPGEGNVAKLIETYKEAGVAADKITHIPMPWQKFESFETQCRQILGALEALYDFSESNPPSGALYMHCTVGEDRTSVVSALTRVMRDRWAVKRAIREEMCARGYAEANKEKPVNVVNAIHTNLSQMFVKLIVKIERGELNWKKIDADVVCKKDPSNLKRFRHLELKLLPELKCSKL